MCLVHPQGLEPWTHWLRVSCSTNWAKDAYLGDNYASCGRCRSLDILNDHCWSFNSACAWSGRRCGRFRDNLRCEPLRVCDCIALHCVKPNPVNRLLDFQRFFFTRTIVASVGAGDGIRTRDFHLGKVTLYHWVTPASTNYYIKSICKKQQFFAIKLKIFYKISI